MKKKYEIPEAEVICTELSDGLLQVIISGGGGIEEDVMPEDEDEFED